MNSELGVLITNTRQDTTQMYTRHSTMLEIVWNSVKQIHFGKVMKDKLQDDILHHNKIDIMPLFGEMLITDLYSQTKDSSKQRKTHYFPRKNEFGYFKP